MDIQLPGMNGIEALGRLRDDARTKEILRLVVARKIRPIIHAIFPLAEVARAHDHLSQRRTRGKVLLTP